MYRSWNTADGIHFMGNNQFNSCMHAEPSFKKNNNIQPIIISGENILSIIITRENKNTLKEQLLVI